MNRGLKAPATGKASLRDGQQPSLEAGFTIEKAKVEAMKARLFARLREHFQRRDRLRLVIGYRRKHLELLVRQGEEEAGKIAQEYRQASAQSDREYAETAAALAHVKREHWAPVRHVRFIAERWPAGSRGFQAPDHPPIGNRRGATFAPHAPTGDSVIQGRRRSATRAVRGAKPGLESPGYRQGIAPRCAALDFGEERELAQLRRLWTRIELEIIRVLEAGHALRESPDYELHRLTAQTPAFFDETVRRQVESLE